MEKRKNKEILFIISKSNEPSELAIKNFNKIYKQALIKNNKIELQEIIN